MTRRVFYVSMKAFGERQQTELWNVINHSGINNGK